MDNLKYFKWSIVVTIVGMVTALLMGGVKALFIVTILSILEVSLSFDNAVVNAKVLKDMSPKWQQRFLTWGMLIAVFGMRIVFPVLIVGIVANLTPWGAFALAMNSPDEYSKALISSHYMISAFGGAFLMMVGLKFFFDEEKDNHWIVAIEEPLIKMGKFEAVEIALVLLGLWITSSLIPPTAVAEFMTAGVLGIITFVAVDGFGAFMEDREAEQAAKRKLSGNTAAQGGLALFIYLEVLDASFSFDGVIGAFAISNNLLIIAIGLGIGAMFVRSLTIMLVRKGTLSEYVFLEHGAFYAIFALAAIMFLKTFIHIPEVITGLIGASFIGLAFMSSLKVKKREEAEATAEANT